MHCEHRLGAAPVFYKDIVSDSFHRNPPMFSRQRDELFVLQKAILPRFFIAKGDVNNEEALEWKTGR
jgi:hypothetical protein